MIDKRVSPPKRRGGKVPPAAVPLFTGAEWSFELLQRVHDAVGEIAVGELGLDCYPTQIEIITSEQMLDAYTSIGMPLFYRHWSFGKRFAIEQTRYRRGLQALAYELVINSDPCICYLMEENTAAMQTLVIAHAAFGHNHFFKNNYLFRQWTRADTMLDYLDFSRRYVADCEERYGVERVEAVLDAAHALMSQGVDRTPKARRSARRGHREAREARRQAEAEASYNVLWRTLPKQEGGEEDVEARREMADLGLPEENILYFLEKYAPRLEAWQRELLRIVRQLAQYFHPQRQTKVMNEGCATFVHYEVLTRLHQRGLITDGAMLEALHSHTSVIGQRDFDQPGYRGLNPYALGFAMMRDIKRICEAPTAEDRAWFPEWAGSGDPFAVLRHAWADYRDESFIAQFLSPAVIREMRLFSCLNDAEEPFVEVSAIHDESGYRRIRQVLSQQYDAALQDPHLEVVEANLAGNRHLVINHSVREGMRLDNGTAQEVLEKIASLWGYRVKLRAVDDDGKILQELEALPEM